MTVKIQYVGFKSKAIVREHEIRECWGDNGSCLFSHCEESGETVPEDRGFECATSCVTGRRSI